MARTKFSFIQDSELTDVKPDIIFTALAPITDNWDDIEKMNDFVNEGRKSYYMCQYNNA